jgi:hypothetical protein
MLFESPVITIVYATNRKHSSASVELRSILPANRLFGRPSHSPARGGSQQAYETI